jgi:hypothetical protein
VQKPVNKNRHAHAWASINSREWFRSLVENLEIFVVRVNAAVIARGGFAGNAEFGQVFEGRVLHQKFCYLVHYLIEVVIT